MAPAERFGRLVLLGETRASALGREYRAVRLSPEGFDRFVSVLRLSPAVSSHAEAARRLVEEARLFARPQHSGFARVLGVGRVEQSVYVSSELVEGRPLEAVLARCREEGFPFAAEHGLMVASRVAAAVDSLHGKKGESGAALVHGLLAPSRIVVSWDGEVKVQGLGLWGALRTDGLLPEEERRYLSPEQAAGGEGQPAGDVYALCLVLREALAGLPPDGSDPVDGLREARLTTSGGQRVPLTPALADLLRQGLARDPASRLPRMSELSRALDGLLFSGDFTPTTFDLAFLMHTLFRDDMERETRELEEARRADYRALLPEKPAERPPGPQTEPAAAATEVPSPTLAAGGPDASGARPAAARASREAVARQAASRMTLGATPSAAPPRRGLWLALGLLLAVLVGGGGGYLTFVSRRALPPGPPAGAAADASQARIRELEERIAQLEREKAEAETRAAEDARQTVEAEAAAGGEAADPSAVAQAQEEARRRARAEQERRQEEERRRLEDARKAEEARLAEATPEPPSTPTYAAPEPAPPAEPPADSATATTPPPTTLAPPPTVPPAAPPSVARGALVALTDPGVIPPVRIREPQKVFPEVAQRAFAEGAVDLRVLVDENGSVRDTSVERSSRPGFGFEVSAERFARGCRFRPATLEGVPVRVWIPMRVEFKQPPRR